MRAACFVAVLMACASVAVAQAPGPQPAPPATPAPAPAGPITGPPAAPAASPPAATPAPAPPPENAPAPPPPADGAPPPPPSYAPAEQPASPATYGKLGGTPEPEIEKGDWDPWEHVGANKHRHDGFMLRLAIGVAFGGMTGDDFLLDGSETAAGGAGFSTTIGIGGALTDNLVLNADLFQMTVLDPTIEVDGHELGDADVYGEDRGVGENVELTGLGVGVTYYFMPVNVYIAGAIGLGQVVFVSDSGERAGSDAGLALHALVGKEWWVGVDWGIGVAGELAFVSAKDDYLGDVTGLGFAVLFSATYN